MTDATAKSTGQVELDELDVMGPIDLMVVEFPHRKTPGEGVKLFVDLVDRGIIRVLDLVFVRKEEDGSVRRLNSPIWARSWRCSKVLDRVSSTTRTSTLPPKRSSQIVRR